MFKLVKRVLFVGLIGGVAALVLGATGAWSYLSSAADVVKNEVKGNIPIDFEIKRAEALIEGILPEINACRRVVATEEVEVEDLKGEIARLEKAQEKSLRKINIQRDTLRSGGSSFMFAGITYNRPEVEADLEKTYAAHRSNEELVESKKRLLKARDGSLVAARQKLETAKVERLKLDSTVQTLYARLRQIQTTEQSGNRFHLDTSKLAQAKELLARCQKRLDIAQKLIDQEVGIQVSGIDVESPVRKNLVEEVDRYLATRAGAPVEGDGKADLTAEARK